MSASSLCRALSWATFSRPKNREPRPRLGMVGGEQERGELALRNWTERRGPKQITSEFARPENCASHVPMTLKAAMRLQTESAPLCPV